MAVKATTDPARELELYFRINRDASITFNCYDENGDAFLLADYTIVANFKKRENDSTNFLQLSSGSGLTKNTSSFILTLTKVQAALFREQSYFLEIVRTKSALEKNWTAGSAIFHNGKFDGLAVSSSSFTISEGATTVTLVISDSSLTDAASQEEVNAGTVTTKYVNPATLAGKALLAGVYATELGFSTDQDIYKDATGLSITFTLAASGNVNGVGIILRLNKPTAVTFPGNFEAHPSSAELDATKLNVYTLVYFSSWNGSGTPRVIYTNSLYTAI